MKFLFMLLLSTQFLYAAESDTALRPTKLTATDGKYFQSKLGATFAISSKIYKSKEEAKAFCDQKLLPMAGEFELFYLITSDQKDTASLLKSVSFRLQAEGRTTSGAWLWNSDKSIPGDITVLRDGAGMSTETVKLSEMDPLLKLNKIEGLPAVCAHMPPMDEDMVDETGRDIIVDKTPAKAKSSARSSSVKKK